MQTSLLNKVMAPAAGATEVATSLPLLPSWKRASDLCFALVALPLLAVSTLVVTLIMSALSPGPVFFRQERVGHRGRRFFILKFRTMRSGANAGVHQAYLRELIASNAPMVKLDAQRDQRLVPGAWLLRASGLDELPQIINILRGEMSLVGPRPCIPNEWTHMTPAQQERARAVPGLTGLWQVSGKNRTTFSEMIALDIQYGRKVRFWNDAKICLLTPWAILQQVADMLRRRRIGNPGLSLDAAEARRGAEGHGRAENASAQASVPSARILPMVVS